MNSPLPLFSIVIPTYRRPEQLTACLRAVMRLEYPRERFEVLVVDDGSTEPPEALVRSFRSHIDVTLLTQPHAGPAQARNTGAAHAKGAFLAFTDDDCAPAPTWLQALAARFAIAPYCAIGGRTLNALPYNLYSTTSQLIIDFVYAYYNADANQARFFASNNLALPTDHFRANGGFDPTFTTSEDRELCDRLLFSGYRMIYASEAVVYHAHALTFRTFWRQHFNYGRGAFRFYQTRGQRRRERVRPEAKSFYLDMLRFPLSQAQGWRALVLATLLTISQGASATGILWEKVNQTRGDHQ